MSNDGLVIGLGLSALLLYNFSSVSSLLESFAESSSSGARESSQTSQTSQKSQTSQTSQTSSSRPSSTTTITTPPPPTVLNATWDTLLGIQPMLKDLALDIVLAKASAALLNESGLRKAAVSARAAAALKRKEQLAQTKLITLQEKKAKLEKMKMESKTFMTNAAEKRQRIAEIRATKDKIVTEKAQMKAIADTKSAQLAKEKVRSDAAKAKVVAIGTKAIAAKSKSTIKNKATFAVFGQKVQNNIAKVLNKQRANFGKQMASIKLPKFTLRGATHTGASFFGLLVAAYDIVRMFDPNLDPWKKKGNPAPVEEIPYEAPVEEERYIFPLCQDIEDQVDGKTIKLCRERRPMPWEELSWNGLQYLSPCPPNYTSEKWGPYYRCTTDPMIRSSGEYITKDVPPSRADFKAGGGFARQYKITMEEGTNYWCGGTNFDSYGGGRCGSGDHMEAAIPLFADALPQEFYDNLGISKFLQENPGKSGRELEDPDYPYQQYRNRDGWGRYEGAIVRLSKNKHQFPQPYRETQIGARGGWDLTPEERIRQVMPGASEEEIKSAIDAANSDEIEGK
jgi:hypothetical protein